MYHVIKSSFIPGLIILAICAVFLFTIKYKVQILNKELNNINSQILTEKENIHVLQAEYAYLTSHKRIQKLADQHLNLQTPKPHQIIEFEKFKRASSNMVPNDREGAQ